MNTYMKMAVVALCSLVIAVMANRYVQPASNETLRVYEEKYRELSNKADVTAEEKQELEKLFKELNSVDNIRADLVDFAIKYTTLFLALIPLTIYSAKKLRLEDNPMFAVSGLIFLAFILSGQIVTGAILGTVFFVSSVTYKKGRTVGQ